MINESCTKKINNFDHIALAVSGGMDSMAMLHWFINNYCGKFCVINIEHGIRGDSSIEDSLFVKEYCKTNNISYINYSVNSIEYATLNKFTIEQSARELRHKIFAEYNITTGAMIATAHHSDDQTETIFMHMARGSGLRGLIGMQFIDGYIIRPLIDNTREEIATYIAMNNIPYREDESNQCTKYTRNYVRQVVLPCIKQAYPGFNKSMTKFARRAQELQAFVDKQMPEMIALNGSVTYPLQKESVIASECMLRACRLLNVKQDIEERHVALVNCLEHGTHCDLPYGLKAYRENNNIIIENSLQCDELISNNHCVELGNYTFGYGILSITDSYDNNCKQLDVNMLPPNTVIRTRRNGDRIKLSYGSKSVADFLNERNIPLRLKNRVPLIAMDSEVFAIGDIAISETVKALGKKGNNIFNLKWER